MSLGELKNKCKSLRLDCYGKRDPLKRRLKEHFKVEKLIEAGLMEPMETKNDFTEPSEVPAEAEEFPHLTKSEFCKYVQEKAISDPEYECKIIIKNWKKEVIEVIEKSCFTFELKSVKWFSGKLKSLKNQVESAEFKARKTQNSQDLLKLKELREEHEREIKLAKIAGYKKRLSEKCQIIIDHILFNKYGKGYPGWEPRHPPGSPPRGGGLSIQNPGGQGIFLKIPRDGISIQLVLLTGLHIMDKNSVKFLYQCFCI